MLCCRRPAGAVFHRHHTKFECHGQPCMGQASAACLPLHYCVPIRCLMTNRRYPISLAGRQGRCQLGFVLRHQLRQSRIHSALIMSILSYPCPFSLSNGPTARCSGEIPVHTRGLSIQNCMMLNCAGLLLSEHGSKSELMRICLNWQG